MLATSGNGAPKVSPACPVSAVEDGEAEVLPWKGNGRGGIIVINWGSWQSFELDIKKTILLLLEAWTHTVGYCSSLWATWKEGERRE